MNRGKEKLYRKVNTRARGVYHDLGGDYKNSKNKKRETIEQVRGAMFSNKHRGVDYTPLYRFLLSKVGCEWEEVFREAKSRLDKTEPIFWMVALHEEDKRDFVRTGESSYFSGLYVDDNGIIQLSNPGLKALDLEPYCNCCTHTLNGKVFGTE